MKQEVGAPKESEMKVQQRLIQMIPENPAPVNTLSFSSQTHPDKHKIRVLRSHKGI